jgi:beta-lactamase regulating signal transducer with metallopeptidase domain
MPLFIQYLIKFSISLALVYLFYQLFLRRLTFYNCNRWYLLGYVVLSFFIPFININPIIEKTNISSTALIHYITVFDKYDVHAAGDPGSTLPQNLSYLFSGWNMVLMILITGSLVLLIRLCIQFLSLKKMKDRATQINHSRIAVYHVEKSIIPFSFGNNIYINQHLHTEKEMEDIILHEYVHVKQRHTVDILMAELLCIFYWYNPFAWLIRNAIKQNLEFIADNKVLQTGMDKKNYQYHLLKVTGMPQYVIASNFNFSSLKKRIAMMNKIKSAKVQMLRFLFLLPILAVILLAFRNREIYSKHSNKIVLSPAGFFNDSIPAKRHDSVQNKVLNIIQDGQKVKVKLRNGKTETYNLLDEAERKTYENKYRDFLEKMDQERQMQLGQMGLQNDQLEQLGLQNEKIKQLQNAQLEMSQKLQQQNSAEQLKLEKQLEELNSKNYLDLLRSDSSLFENALGLQVDSLYGKLLPSDQLLREKLLLQSELDFLTNNRGQLKTADKATLKRLKEEIRIQQIELQKNLKDLELKQQEIEKQLKRFNDKTSYYDGNKNSVNPIQEAKYIDNVSTQNNMMQWSLEKDYPKHPLFLIDAKPVGKDENMIHIDPAEKLVIEFVPKGDILKNYGDAGKDGLIISLQRQMVIIHLHIFCV